MSEWTREAQRLIEQLDEVKRTRGADAALEELVLVNAELLEMVRTLQRRVIDLERKVAAPPAGFYS